jgi:hypothetical protein
MKFEVVATVAPVLGLSNNSHPSKRFLSPCIALIKTVCQIFG